MSRFLIENDITLVRVEDKHGIGPFYSDFREKLDCRGSIYQSHSAMSTMGTDFPYDSLEDKLDELENYRCAYDSIFNLRQFWDCQTMLKHMNGGFKVVQFQVSRAVITQHQCFFRTDRVVWKKTLDNCFVLGKLHETFQELLKCRSLIVPQQ